VRHLLAAAAVALMAGPAMAVDYVQCREMLRVKNEMQEKAAEYQGDSNIAYVRSKCGVFITGSSAEIFEAYGRCTRAAHKQRLLTVKQTKMDPVLHEGWSLEWKTLDSPKAISYYKIALRAAKDMKKIGCPYQ
jgi:hypothetical protein